MIRKILILIHKILGIPLSLIFVMWFVSGFAMIWHSFPRGPRPLSVHELSTTTGARVDSLLTMLPDSAVVRGVSVSGRYGRDVVTITLRDSVCEYYADTFEPVGPFTEELRPVVLSLWCDAPVSRVDTLSDVDQWIPMERWLEKMPIYKYHFTDPEKHQLYMTRDGEVIQFTSASDRCWAWVSGIPHWIYFTPLRRHQELWTSFVKWSALLGCVMCIAGIIVALMVWWHQRKVGGLWHCPYRRPWWRWHFIFGLLFGWCAVTFAFSGYMSMADVPSFLKKEKPAFNVDDRQHGKNKRSRGGGGARRGRGGSNMAPLGAYTLPVGGILKCDSVVSVTWDAWDGHPYYRVAYTHSSRNVDATLADTLADMTLTVGMVRKNASRQLPDSVGWTVELITRYDDDYYGRKAERNPLPVYKVTADDYMHTVLYYDPVGLGSRRVDDDTRTRRLLYSGLHALNIKALTDCPALWYGVMLLLLAGGTLLSLTGLVLALQWIIRKLRGCF